MQDSAHILQQQVQQARTEKQALVISGGQSKNFYGYPIVGEQLNTTIHTGIIDYEPTELVLRARAGTPLKTIEKALLEHQQVLACEPPHFSDNATLGGMVAAGLSGPSRPYRASIQDTVLGATILNGKGEILSFGGKVMKNVAGYDVSRLMVASLGCLGLILDITLKVIPATPAETSYVFTVESNKSVALINDMRKQGLPVTGTCQFQGELIVRFSAGVKEISIIKDMLNKHYSFIEWKKLEEQEFWSNLREQKSKFFDQNNSLWRLSVPADANIEAVTKQTGNLLTEWGGCLHWLKTDMQPADIFTHMEKVNGQATLFRSANMPSPENIFQPLTPSLAQWHKRLKESFDPDGILNPGKMYAQF
ncbi:MAG: glycolate oxidase subunit GlcE [Gammaproteobacteria bacterium]|jgi:glycolate oxidase FAD binding subunit|nr:glycolate oxidase subunit GlcE [Gammaproteobacteria bacterium]